MADPFLFAIVLDPPRSRALALRVNKHMLIRAITLIETPRKDEFNHKLTAMGFNYNQKRLIKVRLAP